MRRFLFVSLVSLLSCATAQLDLCLDQGQFDGRPLTCILEHDSEVTTKQISLSTLCPNVIMSVSADQNTFPPEYELIVEPLPGNSTLKNLVVSTPQILDEDTPVAFKVSISSTTAGCNYTLSFTDYDQGDVASLVPGSSSNVGLLHSTMWVCEMMIFEFTFSLILLHFVSRPSFHLNFQRFH